MEVRFINKNFICNNCSRRFKKLVPYEENSTTCPNCSSNETQILEASEFFRENLDRTYRYAFNPSDPVSQEHHATTDIFNRDPLNLYGDPNTRVGHITQSSQIPTNTRVTSVPLSGESRVNNGPSNIPRQTSYSQTQPQRNEGFQGSSTQPSSSNRQPVQLPRQTIQMPRQGFIFFPLYTISPFNGSVNRTNLPPQTNNVFSFIDFNFFSRPSNEFFFDNFASNYSSNFEDPLTRLIFIQSMNENQPTRPAASKESLKKLERFKMSQEYCKQTEKGKKIECPTCSVCLTEIALNEDTTLVPCGHMFHDPCILKWLETNNTCPVCRFELPTDNPDYERQRQSRNNNNSNHNNTSSGVRS